MARRCEVESIDGLDRKKKVNHTNLELIDYVRGIIDHDLKEST